MKYQYICENMLRLGIYFKQMEKDIDRNIIYQLREKAALIGKEFIEDENIELED